MKCKEFIDWALFQYKDHLSIYRYSIYNDKTVMKPSYCNGKPYTGKTMSSYDTPLPDGIPATNDDLVFHITVGCLDIDIPSYPMLRADSRFWLVNNRGIWSRISRLTSSAWDIKTKERHWWRHNGDSDRRPLSLPLRYDLVTLCLYGDLGQINVIAGILKLRKRFRMSQILFEHGINSLPLVCFRGYGNLSTLSIVIPRLAFGRAWYCDAACG